MTSWFKRINSLVCILLLLSTSPVLAQEGGGDGGAEGAVDDAAQRTLQDAATVAACGLGGAVLGLSTLSFVDKPGDHLKNVLVGGAIGLIIGVGIVAFFQANRSRSNYMDAQLMNPEFQSEENFSTAKRLAWHETSFNDHSSSQDLSSAQQLSLSFSF